MKRTLTLVLGVILVLISVTAFSEGLPSVYFELDSLWKIGDTVEQDGVFSICVNDCDMMPYWEFIGFTDYESGKNPESYPTNCAVLDLSVKNISDGAIKGTEVSDSIYLTMVDLPSGGDKLELRWDKFDFSEVSLEYLTPYGINPSYDAIKVFDEDSAWGDMKNLNDIEILPGEAVRLIFLQSIQPKDDVIICLAPIYLEIEGSGHSQRIQISDPGIYFSSENRAYSEYVLYIIRGMYSCIDVTPIDEWIGQPSRTDLVRYTKTFQEKVGLSVTGDLDWETIRWLDYKLYEWENTGK